MFAVFTANRMEMMIIRPSRIVSKLLWIPRITIICMNMTALRVPNHAPNTFPLPFKKLIPHTGCRDDRIEIMAAVR